MVAALLAGCDAPPEPRIRVAAATPGDAGSGPAGANTVGTGAVAAARYVRLEALSEVNGNPGASIAELNVLDANGAVLERSGWRATADSEEVIGEGGDASHAIDGNPSSFWHTRWEGGGPPHLLVLDMGGLHSVGGFASGPYGAKLLASYVYHANSWEEEFVVTDRAFGLVFANSKSPIDVEIDGAQVEAAPTISTGV